MSRPKFTKRSLFNAHKCIKERDTYILALESRLAALHGKCLVYRELQERARKVLNGE